LSKKITLRDYYALKTIEEALDRTTALLWPPRTGIWLRIAVITLFLGGAMINPFRSGDMEISGIQNSLSVSEAISENMTLFVLVSAGLLVAGLIYVIISAIFQFILVDCLSSGTISLTRTFRLRWKKGLHLFFFYIILLFLILITIFMVILVIMVPAFLTGQPGLVTILFLLIRTLLLLFLILIPVWTIAILTADFVVPVMIVDDCGIISGWRRIIVLFHGRWAEAGIYTILKISLIFFTGLLLGLIIFLISIPLGFIGAVLTIGTGLTPVITPTGAILIGFGSGAMILISLLVLAPITTFFRYYSLAMLLNLDPRYSLLPE
jgi:hypothetical protein